MIAQKFIPKGFFSNGLKQFLAEAKEANSETWNYGSSTIECVTDVRKCPTSHIARLSTKPFELELLFSQIATQDNDRVDLRVRTLCKIANPRVFLYAWKDRLDALNCLSNADLTGRAISLVKSLIIDLIAKHTYEQLVPKHNLPDNAYLAHIAPIFERELGLDLSEITVEYFSEQATERQALGNFQEEYQKRAQREQITVKYEEAARIRQLETEERIREIKHNQQLKDEERQMELEKIQFEAVGAQMLGQLNLERERLKIEEDIAVIRDQTEERERIKQERRSIEEQFERFQGEFRQSQKNIVEALRGIEETLKNGIPISGPPIHILAECSTAMLAMIGLAKTPEMYRARFRELEGRYDKVPMKVIAATPRDIGCRKYDELRIGQSLAFEFVSPKDGYVTIINLGTSGRFWLHVPNVYVPVEQAVVKSNREYAIPGDLLLPPTELRRHGLDYMECGPVGWEELVILITPMPLMTKADIFEANVQSPFSAIQLLRLDSLFTQLNEMPASKVGYGVLGINVFSEQAVVYPPSRCPLKEL